MDKFFEIDADPRELLAALDRLGDIAERHVKNAAAVTAGRIQQEGRARVRRRTGATAAAITVEEATGPLGGYRVFVGPTRGANGLSRPDNLPLWIETGTVKMVEKPFMFNSAALEEGPHYRRIVGAIQDAIDEVGLGE